MLFDGIASTHVDLQGPTWRTYLLSISPGERKHMVVYFVRAAHCSRHVIGFIGHGRVCTMSLYVVVGISTTRFMQLLQEHGLQARSFPASSSGRWQAARLPPQGAQGLAAGHQRPCSISRYVHVNSSVPGAYFYRSSCLLQEKETPTPASEA
jgi:hypothetical protein